MSTTLDAIYEHGMFRPLSRVPSELKDHERVRITIITDEDADLMAEFAAWEAASDEDLVTTERKLEGISQWLGAMY